MKSLQRAGLTINANLGPIASVSGSIQQVKHVLGYLYLILVVLGKGCYIFTLSRPNLLFLR